MHVRSKIYEIIFIICRQVAELDKKVKGAVVHQKELTKQMVS